MNDIGKRIKRLRMKNMLSQRDLARELDVANSTISNWENGHRAPSLIELKRIATFFKTSLSYFDIDTIDDNDTRSTIEKCQVIDHKPLSVSFTDTEKTIFLTSSVIILLSFFIPYLIVIGFIMFGSAGFMYCIYAFVFKHYHKHNYAYKKVEVSIEQKVVYVNKSDSHRIRNVFAKLKAMHYALFITLLLLLVMLNFIFGSNNLNSLNFSFSLLILIDLVVVFATYRTVTKSGVDEQKVDYYKTYYYLKYPSLYFLFFLGIITHVAIGVLLSFNLFDHFTVYVAVIGFLSLIFNILSFAVFLIFQDHISKYSLYYISNDGDSAKIE